MSPPGAWSQTFRLTRFSRSVFLPMENLSVSCAFTQNPTSSSSRILLRPPSNSREPALSGGVQRPELQFAQNVVKGSNISTAAQRHSFAQIHPQHVVVCGSNECAPL